MEFDDPPEPIPSDLDRLRSDWPTVTVTEERLRSPADAYDPDAVVEPIYRHASTWVRRDGEVLLVAPIEDEGWAGPGGRHEPGETYEETAVRETREETGLEVDLRGVIEAVVTRHRYGDRATEWALGVVFDARPVGGDLSVQPEEIERARWFDEVPDAEDLVFPRSADYPV